MGIHLCLASMFARKHLLFSNTLQSTPDDDESAIRFAGVWTYTGDIWQIVGSSYYDAFVSSDV